MKKFIKLGFFVFSFLFVALLASCEEQINPLENVIDYSEYPDIDMETVLESGKNLSSLAFDTENAKVHYYVGEKFTTEGLVVNAVYVQYKDGAYQSTKVPVENYFYDASDADLNKAGEYAVEFTYREGNKVIKSNLTIKVTPSYLADLGVEYLAGLEPTKTVYEISKGATFDPKNDVKFLKKYMIGTAEGVLETKIEEMTDADIEALVVESTLNTNTAGKYVVSYKYNTSVVRADNTVYEYELQSFVVVIVK